jgi:hypothetical protein
VAVWVGLGVDTDIVDLLKAYIKRLPQLIVTEPEKVEEVTRLVYEAHILGLQSANQRLRDENKILHSQIDELHEILGQIQDLSESRAIRLQALANFEQNLGESDASES